jgi:acid ceramidase
LTGIKPGVFSVSINERNSPDGGYIGLIEWIYNINRNQTFITFAIRDMLTKSESYDQSVKYLAEVPLLAPCYYIVAGTKPKQVREYIRFFNHINLMYLFV